MDKTVWAKLENSKDPYSCYVRQIGNTSTVVDDIKTADELFRRTVAKYGEIKCYGTREVFGEEELKMDSGKMFKKLSLGEYNWLTYNAVDEKIEHITRGLLALGIQPKKPVAICAETRIEWILTAQACFRINVPVVTLYATLGEDGLVHCIKESEVSFLITSADLLPKIKNVIAQVSAVSHVVYMEGLVKPPHDIVPKNIKLIPFAKMEELGRQNTDNISYSGPEPKDLAILMYTSGSTGIPKGVMITHKNVMSSIKGFSNIINEESLMSREEEMYIAYLPVAHVLELAAECYLSSLGVPIGFSSPQTLTDFSVSIKKGTQGDVKVLKPTLMVCVPLMLDRIRKSILLLAGKEGTFSRLMFDFAVSYKGYWSKLGFKTPMLDWKLLKTYRDFLGGKLRIILCGGAPLSPDTQVFIRSCLNVKLMQAYGATETAACSTCMDQNDFSSGRVGSPLKTSPLRLVDWPEGNYYVTDRPNPRGEIVAGGDSITNGYLNREDETRESFKEEKGERWFYTGDIGEMYPNGTLKIIDRKKDLIKLQFGEYIALGKVEAELKTCPLVENICVVGNSTQNYIVALIMPNQHNLVSLAKDLGKGHLTFTEMCSDLEIAQEARKRIAEYGKKCRLFGAELPAKIKFCSEDWTPESGLVTAAFKIRRKIFIDHYQEDINQMYSENIQNGSLKSA